MEESKEKQNKGTASADPLKTCLDSTQEFFDMWMDSYQSTFGKFTQMPTFGPIREKQEKIMKGFPIYVNLYNTWIESNINFQTVFTGAMKKTYDKMITETKGEITTEKYKDFYKIWLETYSETLKEFMRSGHFTTDMGKLMTNFMDYQKYNKEMIEENFLKPGNLPTKTDIDEINKDLYTLRKTLKGSLKDLEKKIDEKTNQISNTIGEYGEKAERIRSDVDNLEEEINEKMSDISKRIDELYKRIDDHKIQLESDKKIAQVDLDKKIADASKKTKAEIQLELDKKITQVDLDKKIADASKKTKAEIQTNLDNKISEVSKRIGEQQSEQQQTG